jgi:PAS domain S-box-containing protein
VRSDPRTAASAAALEAAASRAMLNVPVMEGGRLVAQFYAASPVPRRWTAEEVQLMHEVAARTRAAAERRRAEAAERAAADRFRAVADAAPVMIWMNDADGRRVFVNRAYRDHFGLGDDAALGGFDYRAFLHPEDREAYLAANAESVGRRERFSAEARSRRADGQWRMMRADMLPRFGEGGRFEGYVGTLIDVTDARAAEAVLRDAAAAARDEAARAHEALRQAQKMEAMGQLTGGVAHDFNNLLTPIVGAFDLLLRREVGDERTRRLVEGGLQSAERARTLVQRLLAFARRQPLQPRALNLQGLVTGMADLLASTLGPRVALDLRLDPGLPPVRADANQLEMAVLNLAVNARDAMPDGGRLEIAAGYATHAPPVNLPPGTYARLCVADTGVGMDAETARRAVEPFFSTKGVGRGTGLGLSMVHGLAAQLGGAISIESEPGRGTSVHLWLPLADGEELGEAAAPGAAAPERAVGTVLLVDDEPLVRASAAAMLADFGWRVVEAGDAEAALALLDAAEPDLLMTDHLMPGMTGTELAREVRRRRPGIRVLVSSGYAEVDGVAADLPRLVKPFRAAELRAALGAL